MYNACLELRGKLCVVVGGGAVATRKSRVLLESSARVVLVSPAVTEELLALIRDHQLIWHARVYEADDLQDAWLVFAATADEETNRRVAADARQRRIFVNIADSPAQSDFHVPSVIRRGPLSIAVSTNGHSPMTAREVRRWLEDACPPSLGGYIEWMGKARRLIRAQVADESTRRAIMERLQGRICLQTWLAGDGEPLRAAVATLRAQYDFALEDPPMP